MQIWSINYYILKMSRYTNIVYIGRYLVLTYIERFFSTVCCFFSYICWSVNCMSWVSKFSNFFWHIRKLRQDLYSRALILSFMENSFLMPRYFFCFFIWFVNCLRYFFSHYELSLWIMEHISEMSRNVSINLYLRPCTIAIYGKFCLYCLYRQTFLVCKLWKSGL